MVRLLLGLYMVFRNLGVRCPYYIIYTCYNSFIIYIILETQEFFKIGKKSYQFYYDKKDDAI